LTEGIEVLSPIQGGGGGGVYFGKFFLLSSGKRREGRRRSFLSTRHNPKKTTTEELPFARRERGDVYDGKQKEKKRSPPYQRGSPSTGGEKKDQHLLSHREKARIFLLCEEKLDTYRKKKKKNGDICWPCKGRGIPVGESLHSL